MVILLLTPVLLAVLVAFFTRNPKYEYSSETTLYTGIASGSSVEMDKSFSYFANNTAFDNLINVINSRETQQEVSIHLLAQHLMLENCDPRYISKESFDYVRKITPDYVKALVVKPKIQNKTDTSNETSKNDTIFSFSKLYASSSGTNKLQAPLDQDAFEQTVKNLTKLATSSDTNFVYHILYYDTPHYSLKEISTINAQRIGSSDLVKLKFTSDDPGIVQQTLVFLTDVCIKNFKDLKENRSDAVVKYFEFQVNQATQKLKAGEEKLLSFNMNNNIINYYEQSKAVAIAKEALDVDFNNMKIKLAGSEAAIKRLEDKLDKQQKIQLKSGPVLEKRNQLSIINSKIATIETVGQRDSVNVQKLALLKLESEKLREEMRKSVAELSKLSNTTEGLPVSSLLSEWIVSVVSYEETKAGLAVLGKRISDFQKQYEIYAPAGANLKKIEREISVSEQEFLELLHGLNLAKLKMQDIELSSNLKPVDLPFYPLSPNPTKRKLLIVAAVLVGFLTILSTLLALEYFDDTLRNPKKASKILGLVPVGIFPKVYLKPGVLNFPFIANRLIEMLAQQLQLLKDAKNVPGEPFQIILFSTTINEGKTVLAQNLASVLKKNGNKVIVLRNSPDTTLKDNLDNALDDSSLLKDQCKELKRFSVVNWILGYTDSRVDYNSPFLCEFGSTLTKKEYFFYRSNNDFISMKDYKELLVRNNYKVPEVPDYVIIEIPSILYNPYPSGLVASVDLPVMVCRANRLWSVSDQNAVESFIKNNPHTPQFILNGVELEVIESVLGELQKNRSWFRKTIKKIIRFQFFTSNLP
jgi:uncharacterized protein involved in exopolysaccharide biosynthesis/cellulose biosynthesis protein BcsQ